MKHTKIYHITARFLLAAILLAVSWTSATAAETAVPYAHIENDELVFYYDGNITDTDWAIVGFQNPESRGWHESASSIAGVRFDDSFKSYAPTVASYWFYGMSQVQTIDLSEIDMSQLTEADGMFQNCTRLTTIYVNESWPAAEATVTPGGSTSSVTGVDMFNGCRSLVGGSNTAYDGQYTGYSYAHIDGGVDYPGYFTYKNAQVSTLEIYSISKSVTYTANQPITPTQSVTMTPGNDSEWKTDLAIGLTDTTTGESNDPLEFKASIYYPNSTETFSFLDALRGTLNPKDGDLTTNSETGEVTNSGKVYNPNDKNLPKSGAYIIYEALQNGSLIIPIRVTADKSLFVVTADGSLVLDMQFKDAAGTTQVFKTDPLCSVSSEYISGFISLNVEAGQKYYVFCNASRPRIAGYIFSPDPITIDPATMADVKSVLNTEPYAVLDGTTLYFYYDDQKSARGGMDIGPFASSSDRGWDGYVENIKSVEFDQSFSNCTSITSTALWFVNCYQLETITNLNYLNTENVTSMKEMFSDCSGLTSLDVSNFNTGKVTDMYHLFSNCQQVTSLDVKDFNTANVTNMGHMFAGCSELTSLDVRNFNTSNVTDMEQMFYNCSKVTNLDLSNFNTSNVTTMYQMFVNCSGLTRLDLGKFNTSNVTNMGEMFTGCSGLTYLNLSSFNTSQVTYMGGMFNNCSSLTSLDVSNFNTSNVTNMFGLFLGCKQLTTLDLSNFETTKTTDMSVMFASASQLKTIYVGSGWNVSNVRLSDNMFLNCASLVGGAGTVFDENHVDHTYARIDGGTSAPGYFTEKNAANPSTDEHNLYPAKNIVWDDITWKNAHNSRDKDNNYMPFLMGSGLGYKTLLAESFYSEEQGANITRPYYTYVDYEAGETGVPGYGLYYRFTPKTSGQLRFNTWVNKGNRKTFVVKGSTGAALEPYVDYTFDGYVNGQNNITDGVSYPIYFTADEIKARHDESGTVNKYVVDKGNQIFWGWITLNVEAGESYYIYQQTSQLGFGGYDFIPTGGTAESYVSCIRSTTDDTFALSSEFAAVVDENGKATNVTERGSFVRFGTTNMDVEALGSRTPISVEADLDIQPYAVLSDNNTVLTFYYDDQKTAKNGMDVGPFDYYSKERRGWSPYTSQITKAVFDQSFDQCTTLTSTAFWFTYMTQLETIEHIEYLHTDNVEDMDCMFDSCFVLRDLDVSHFVTAKVRNMQCMFNRCEALTSLNLSNFNTSSCTFMRGMFYDCKGLTSLDLSSFNTANNTSTEYMFQLCSSLENIIFGSGFSTENVTNMRGMFDGCSSLKSLNVGGFNTQKVSLMSIMFRGCSSLTSLDVSKFNTEKVTDMGGMFSGCEKLTNLDVSSFNTSNVTMMAGMFLECSALKSVDLKNFNTSQVTSMQSMFAGCKSLETLDVSHFDTGNVTNMKTMFGHCENLMSLDVTNFNTSKVLLFNGMFQVCPKLTTLDLSSFNTERATEMSFMFIQDSQLTDVNVGSFNTANVTTTYGMFAQTGLETLDLRNFDTHNVKDMNFMFAESTKLSTIYVGNSWSTANVEVGDSIFDSCPSLVGGQGTVFNPDNISVDYAHVDGGENNPGYLTEGNNIAEHYAVLSDNNTVLTFYYDGQKTARNGMDIGPFAYLEHGFGEGQRPWHDQRESITSVVIDASMAADTALVSTGWWFYGCTNLKSVSGWENLPSEKIVDMWGTFEYCSSLPNDPAAGGPDFSKFNSASLKRTCYMFHGCTSMTSLDLSTFNTANVTENEGMFEECTALTTIYVGNGWDMTNATDNWVDNMFQDCTSLVGGAGTRYDANNIGTSYAHIDGGIDNPGYLTELIRKPLTAADYFEWTGMKANATKKSESPYPNCYYILGQSAEIPYGEPDVNPYTYADLSAYDRLEVTATGNTPRILLNRDSVGGQWNEDESLSHMIESTQRGWSSKYFSHSGNVWTVDLKQIVADKGFAHLNAIKGDSWSAVTVIKIELVKINSTATAGTATFDRNLGVLTVDGDLTMQQACEQAGGRQPIAERITSLIWNSSVVLTESDLDGFTNPNMLIFVDSKDKTTLTRNNVVIEGKARKVVLSDVASGNGDFWCPQEFFADSIIYTHNYKQATEIGVSRGWETIALPFDVQTITHEKNGVIAPFGSSASDKHFWLRTLVDEQGLARATKIEANHAYLISMPNNGKYPAEYNLAGNVTFATAGVVVPETIYRASQLTTDNGRIILMPNFLRLYASEYYYVLNVGEARGGHPEGSVFEVNYRETLPFQAFTYHEGNQNPSRFISLDELMEGTTGIETIEQPQWSGAEQWWSIDGRKLNGKPSQKGVYIRNGKKVVVKATF